MPPIDTVTEFLTTGEPFPVPPPLGNVQAKLVPVAVSVKVPPVQTGLGRAETFVGIGGFEGSLKVKGPAAEDVHPASVTVMFE